MPLCDVSFPPLPLQAARKKLGPKAVYMLGDITDLPLVDDSVDTVVSLHTLWFLAGWGRALCLRCANL